MCHCLGNMSMVVRPIVPAEESIDEGPAWAAWQTSGKCCCCLFCGWLCCRVPCIGWTQQTASPALVSNVPPSRCMHRAAVTRPGTAVTSTTAMLCPQLARYLLPSCVHGWQPVTAARCFPPQLSDAMHCVWQMQRETPGCCNTLFWCSVSPSA